MPQAYSHTSRALGQVKALTSKYEALALAEDTKWSYSRGANAYIDFCLQLDLTDNQGKLLDISEDQLMYFAAHCAGSRGLAPGTIHNYLYGIRSWYITKGLPDPLKNDNGQPLYRLARVLRGIKKCHQVKRGKRLPLTIPIMRALVQLLSMGCFGQTEDRMLLAVINLAFFGFLRCGEFTVQRCDQFDPARHLTVNDVTFYPNHIRPDYMTLRLKYSKTDPFGKGHIVTLYRTNRPTCPVTSMQVYLNSRGQSLEEPLFLTRDSVPLTRKYFLSLLHEALEKIGVSPSFYSGHSFRMGAATTAAASGLQDWLIKALGRWTSDCYRILYSNSTPNLAVCCSISCCLSSLQDCRLNRVLFDAQKSGLAS